MSGHALIAGAGIGGLSAALFLAATGWRVSLFESAPVIEAVGAGLQLSPNATAILRQIGVLERLGRTSLAPKAVRVLRARDGATLALMRLDRAESRWGAPYLLAHRADLQRALLDAAAGQEAIALHTGVALTGFASGPGGVTAALRKGMTRFEVAGDCLIGADGSRSLVRGRLLGGDDALNMSRRAAWRALVPADRAPPEALRPESCLWLGRKAHLVHYPLRGGSVVNVVAIVAQEQGKADEGPFWSNAADPAELVETFKGWHESARALLAGAGEWRKWRLHDRDPLPGWSAGRVALLGDAAHPMLPFLAQGAAQAIEDAGALGAALGRVKAGGDIPGALSAYGASRLPRASRVQLESRAQERIYHLSGPAAFARDLALRAMGGERLLARYDWLYRAAPA
ncbi:monooxygenase FAD-binding [Methylocella silvestris BL2]|uniref:Monooxygenase FAD-binding n=1 Tax=Methylocella silvestris (strain DSM 15510 / CIP 108128 / LMG 27833 / NCIMB 13906 / BL2) TaxID=395965 RepID=B8EK04_METSB|nr:FAD-dependent monooxygenase [Methylocella silvestris]ACK49951.1 monooxygenase FAD-binding [Methylocella silvestris BL2]